MSHGLVLVLPLDGSKNFEGRETGVYKQNSQISSSGEETA